MARMQCLRYNFMFVLPLLVVIARGALGFGSCRQDPLAQSHFCGLPYSLSNFQGYFACNKDVQVGRPQNVEELLALVKAFDRVKGVGVGHSWSRGFFCAGDTSDAIDIVLTEFTSTRFINALPSSSWFKEGISSLPIQVDEDGRTVTVDGGVQQRVLLDYLAKYITVKSPLGWTLPAFSWYIDQTIAGAVATGTHGSSLKYGSLSGQVMELEVALANGTLYNVSALTNPHLFAALQVSVGRLGIITKVKLPIVPQQAVKRTLDVTSIDGFVSELQSIQDNYKAALSTNSESAITAALKPLDEVQVFVFPFSNELWKIGYRKLLTTTLDGTTPLSGVVDTEKYYQSLTADGTTSGPPKVPYAYSQHGNKTLPGSLLVRGLNVTGWDLLSKLLLYPMVAPGVYSARRSYLTQADLSSTMMADLDPYDQYEASVTLDRAASCLAEVNELWKAGAAKAYLVPGLIRFVSEEGPYLSNTNGGPRMFVNLEDHTSHTFKQPNTEFEAVMRHFVEKCDARLHWGKAGWPWLQPCFDGAAHFEKWCDFGCAVEDLDPSGKFRTDSNAWVWRATLNGQDVPLRQCCTAEGFSSKCKCAARTDRTGCPAEGIVLHIEAD